MKRIMVLKMPKIGELIFYKRKKNCFNKKNIFINFHTLRVGFTSNNAMANVRSALKSIGNEMCFDKKIST